MPVVQNTLFVTTIGSAASLAQLQTTSFPYYQCNVSSNRCDENWPNLSIQNSYSVL